LELAAVDPRTDVLVDLAFGTGARVGVLCALEWSDIDLDADTMTIRGTLHKAGTVGPPKAARSRRLVALPWFAIEALRRELVRRPGERDPCRPATTRADT
jgi:integrase